MFRYSPSKSIVIVRGQIIKFSKHVLLHVCARQGYGCDVQNLPSDLYCLAQYQRVDRCQVIKSHYTYFWPNALKFNWKSHYISWKPNSNTVLHAEMPMTYPVSCSKSDLWFCHLTVENAPRSYGCFRHFHINCLRSVIYGQQKEVADCELRCQKKGRRLVMLSTCI